MPIEVHVCRLYAHLSDEPEARRLLEEAIRIERLQFDPRHVNLVIRYLNLAHVLWDSGEQDGAATLAQIALAIFLFRLGPEHEHSYANTAQGALHTLDPAWVEAVKAGEANPFEYLPLEAL